MASLLVILAAACGSDDASGFAERAAGDADFNPGAKGPEPSEGAEPPPEKEVESDYEAPVATGNVVWIANPKSGRIALVDASTLQVRTVEAGNGPTYLASVPGQSVDTTLVLNVLSEDATLLKATPTGITTTTFKTAKQVNTLVFSEDGRFAIAWADARKLPSAPRTQGFQDLTVLDLVNGTSTILAVGYRPVAVGFAQGKPRAHAVTQDGVAILDLSGAPKVTKNVAISNTPNEDPGTRDVFVTKDGQRAFVRRDGSNAITIVALDTDARTDITLSGPVTDLDLADTGDRAVAVVRATSEVAVMPLADPANKTSVTVTGETIGSVAIAPGGNKALLYTNAVAVERFSILDLGQGAAFRTVRLYSPVLGIFSTPDALHAVVLHDKTTGEGGSPGAFSVVPIGQTLPAKIVAAEAPLTAVATTNDRAIVAERNDATKTFGAYLARMPQLMVERYPLASPPIAVGAVPGAKRVFVAQQHPEGRLTFIDLESGVARTLTGFELSSRVVDGSKP
ncbi:MAG: hypothetical protein J0I07_03630 [Myxococcales bacterium]|nr:hypothetical protein [Myxococcales bacterium]